MKFPPQNRLLSIDAYRGFVMLAMVSGGFAVANTVDLNPELAEGANGKWWRLAAYQLTHVKWHGCSFWDLIQPSFMFLVGVSMPFSYQKRMENESSGIGMAWHAFARSVVLVVLGIFLYSQSTGFVNFKLVNVLTQIGLGYFFVYLLLKRSMTWHLAAIVLILGGYWGAFYQHIPSEEIKGEIVDYMAEQNISADSTPEEIAAARADAVAEISQYPNDHRSHWNKHTNIAGAFDRWFLNLFPRNETKWAPTSNPEKSMGFWTNSGGYQTLNFIPSIATMIFGLIAGLILISDYSSGKKLLRLLMFAALCFIIGMAMDTPISPFDPPNPWSACPVVKKIWTPSWTFFSAGWTFTILSAFYLVVDVIGFRLWTFPFAIVGMNSIAMYCMAQLIQGWVKTMLANVLRTVDAMFNTTAHATIFDGQFSLIYQSICVVVILWLACLYLYRHRLFFRL